jgi:transcriptional regulator with XRE-family HTH domain
MGVNLSSIADKSSVRDEGREKISAIADIGSMTDGDWKARLALGIENSGKSQREISLAAGLGPGYVNSILRESKDPTITNLIKLCEAADLSLYYILVGVDVSREEEDLLRLLTQADSDVKQSVLTLLRSRRSAAAS